MVVLCKHTQEEKALHASNSGPQTPRSGQRVAFLVRMAKCPFGQ